MGKKQFQNEVWFVPTLGGPLAIKIDGKLVIADTGENESNSYVSASARLAAATKK